MICVASEDIRRMELVTLDVPTGRLAVWWGDPAAVVIGVAARFLRKEEKAIFLPTENSDDILTHTSRD